MKWPLVKEFVFLFSLLCFKNRLIKRLILKKTVHFLGTTFSGGSTLCPRWLRYPHMCKQNTKMWNPLEMKVLMWDCTVQEIADSNALRGALVWKAEARHSHFTSKAEEQDDSSSPASDNTRRPAAGGALRPEAACGWTDRVKQQFATVFKCLSVEVKQRAERCLCLTWFYIMKSTRSYCD